MSKNRSENKRYAAAIVALVSVLAMRCSAQDHIFNMSTPFSLQVTSVRSLNSDERVGFSKALELYAVTAYGPETSYTLYCVKYGPEAGKTYTALTSYVDSSLSALHLWPVEKQTLNLPSGTKTKGRVYRVVIIQDIRSGPKPDLACDIRSETARTR
jgi:hypothetical protein